MAFKLTDRGDQVACNPTAKMTPMDRKVVGFMYTARIPVELEEIMDDAGISDEGCVTVMKRLVGEGYVEET